METVILTLSPAMTWPPMAPPMAWPPEVERWIPKDEGGGRVAPELWLWWLLIKYEPLRESKVKGPWSVRAAAPWSEF